MQIAPLMNQSLLRNITKKHSAKISMESRHRIYVPSYVASHTTGWDENIKRLKMTSSDIKSSVKQEKHHPSFAPWKWKLETNHASHLYLLITDMKSNKYPSTTIASRSVNTWIIHQNVINHLSCCKRKKNWHHHISKHLHSRFLFCLSSKQNLNSPLKIYENFMQKFFFVIKESAFGQVNKI